MVDDPEPDIRCQVAERCDRDDLETLLQDDDWTVRLKAVERALLRQLQGMENEPDLEVQRAIETRIKQLAVEENSPA